LRLLSGRKPTIDPVKLALNNQKINEILKLREERLQSKNNFSLNIQPSNMSEQQNSNTQYLK
jgi:hypothetical protein